MPPNDSDGSKTPWQTWAVVTILVAAIPVVPKIIELWHPAPTSTPSPSPSASSISTTPSPLSTSPVDPLSGVWDQYAFDNYGNLQYIEPIWDLFRRS